MPHRKTLCNPKAARPKKARQCPFSSVFGSLDSATSELHRSNTFLHSRPCWKPAALVLSVGLQGEAVDTGSFLLPSRDQRHVLPRNLTALKVIVAVGYYEGRNSPPLAPSQRRAPQYLAEHPVEALRLHHVLHGFPQALRRQAHAARHAARRRRSSPARNGSLRFRPPRPAPLCPAEPWRRRRRKGGPRWRRRRRSGGRRCAPSSPPSRAAARRWRAAPWTATTGTWRYRGDGTGWDGTGGAAAPSLSSAPVLQRALNAYFEPPLEDKDDGGREPPPRVDPGGW